MKSAHKDSEYKMWVTFSGDMWQTSLQEKEKVAGFLIFLDYSHYFLYLIHSHSALLHLSVNQAKLTGAGADTLQPDYSCTL